MFNSWRKVIYYSPDGQDGGDNGIPTGEPSSVEPTNVSSSSQGEPSDKPIIPPSVETPKKEEDGGQGSSPSSIGDNTNIPVYENWKKGEYANDKPLIYQLPHRGKEREEYNKAFEKLDDEQRAKVEKEILDLNNGNEELSKLMQEKFDGKPPVSHETSDGEPSETKPNFSEWTEDEWTTLDAKTKANIESLMAETEKFAPLMDGSVERGLKTLEADPIIQARIEQIKAGVNPEDLVDFNPDSIVNDKDLLELDFQSDPDDAIDKVNELLKKAYTQGHQKAEQSSLLRERDKEIAFKRDLKFKEELKDLTVNNKSLSSDLKYNDPKHPLNPFLVFLRDNFSTADMDRFSAKELYGLYQTRTGGKDKAIQNQRQNLLQTMRQNLKSFERSAVTGEPGLSGTPPQSQNSKNMWNGIDLGRYASDFTYRKEVFGKADDLTQKKLEVYSATGKMTE